MKSIRDLMDLRGRVALITGGAGHLGRAMSEALAELGCSIASVDLRDAEFLVDITDDRAVHVLVQDVIRKYGRLDVLINNAALVGTSALEGWAVPFEAQSAATWRNALEVNLTAPFVLVQACREHLIASTHGSIINIGSIYGMAAPDMSLYSGTPLGNPAAYAASKAGLLQFSRWLSTVLAPSVRVNTITVGGIWRNQDRMFCDRYVARTPLQRMATEEDLKGAVAYLASDLSAYVTGQNVVVDGGWTAW